jgi:translation elongation factor EF-Tu-like GTPase
MYKRIEPDLIARVTYLTKEQGGRSTYTASGYRPHIKFEGKEYFASGEQHFINPEMVFPGETAIAEIRIASKEAFTNYLFVGQKFEFSEGSRLIGKGEILEVVNKHLLREGV